MATGNGCREPDCKYYIPNPKGGSLMICNHPDQESECCPMPKKEEYRATYVPTQIYQDQDEDV